MAHTDACKYQVCEFMGKLVDKGMSIRTASFKTQQESDGIPAKTIERWWGDIKKKANEECLKNETATTTDPTTQNDSGKEEKVVKKESKAVKKLTREECWDLHLELLKNGKSKNQSESARIISNKSGESFQAIRHKIYKRPKDIPQPEEKATEAMQFAVIAISQLERIRQDDPKRGDALNRVLNWIEKQLKLKP